jgi:gliding motility-associated-like protein
MRARYYLLLVYTLLMGTQSYSQGLCPSSALAPVFQQTFGQGALNTSKTSVPAGFNTNYEFQDDDPLSDGEYIVTPRVQNSQRNDWAIGGDHTGNTNGNMFLVNAGTGAALFFTQQVDNLCPGSTYNFSAWLANVNTTSHTLPICDDDLVYPKVTFRIKNTSGTVLGTYTTPNLPLTANRVVPPNWLQYGFSFTLPAGTTSLVLEMVDFYGGQPQCGNDLAIDDIVFSACTPTASTTFSNSSTAFTMCTGTSSSMSVALTNSPFTTPAYQWQKSTNGGANWSNVGTASTSATSYLLTNVSLTDAGMYRVIVGPDVASLSSNTCVTASNAVTLTVNASPTVVVGSNSPVCSGNPINLTATPSGATPPYTYSWTGPNSFSSLLQNPSIATSAAVNAGTYTVVVTANNSCTVTGTTNVTVNTTPTVATISGGNGGCVGSTFTLTNATPGGTWSSSHPSIATVNASGLVSVITTGAFTVTYTVSSNGCSASASKGLTAHSVSLPPSIIECNSSTVNTQSNADYVPTYSNNNASSTYLWTITPAPNYQGGTGSTDRYPKIQYADPLAYNVLLQFTSAGVTCSATQTVYRNGTEASSTINGPATESVCNSTNSINLSATVAAYTNQYAWTTSGTGSFSNANALSTTYTFSAADKASGNVTITFTGTTTLNINGNCTDNTDTDTKTITIQLPNTGTNSSSTICSNQLFSHTPSSSVSGSTFTWVSAVLGGTGSGNATSGSGDIGNTLTNLSATTDFVVQYTVTPLANSCPGTPYTVTVTVKPLPTLSITNNASVVCTGASTNIQLSDLLSGTQYTWASAVITGTASGNSNNAVQSATNTITDALINTTNLAATVRYSVTAHSTAGCIATGTTDVTVYPQPTTANAGGDQSLCNVTAANLSGNTPTSGTGTWTRVSGPNTPTFTNAASPSTSVTGMVIGTYVFRWTISNGVCAASQDDVTVLVSPLTNEGTLSADATVCATVNNGALTITGYTGSIINWQSSDDNGATWTTSGVTNPVFPYNGLTTTTLFKASIQSGSCSVLFSNTVNITVLQPPTTANAGSDQQYNGISSTTLAGNDPVEGTGTWTQVSGPNTAVFSDPGLYNSTVSGLTVGTYIFKWAITNGSCGDSEDEMALEVLPPTVAGTVSADATVCATGGNGATLTLSGYVGNVLRWQYSTDNGGNWLDITNTTATHIYSNLTTTTLFRAEVQNGTDAPGFSSHVTITVLQPVTVANAGDDQVLCNLTSAVLAGNNPTSGTGTWSWVSGPTGVSFGSPNSHNSSVTGLTTGTYQLRWIISNGGVCPSTNDVVDITIVAPTNPGTVVADATVCATSNGGTLTITGFTGTIVQGEISIDNGANWAVYPHVVTTTITYPTLTTTTQFRALVKNSVCPAVHTNIVTITVLQAVTTANAGNDQQLCAATSATLTANNPSSGTGTWTQVSGPTATFTNASAYNTAVNGLIPGTYEFKWTISNGICASSEDNVIITVHPSTVPGSVTGIATVCSGANSGTLTLTGNTGSIVRWEFSTNGGASWNDITNTSAIQNYSNLTATTLYKASVQSGVCLEQYTNNVLITVNPVTVPGTVTGATTVCTGTNNGSLSLSGNNGTVVRWEFSTDGTNWTPIANTTTTQNFSNLSTTTIYKALVQNGVCAAVYSNQVTVTVNTATIAGSLSAPAVLCLGNNNGTLTLSGNNGSVVRWEYSTDGGAVWNFISNTGSTQNYTNLTTPTDYRAVIQNGVCVAEYSNTVSLSINPVTVAGIINGATTVCTGSNSGTLTLGANTGSVLQWEYSTDGTNWTPIVNTTTTQNFSNLTITTQYRARVQSGVCAPDYTNPVSVTVSPATVPGTLSGTATVCAGTNSGNITLSGYTGNILQWEYSTDGGGTWDVIAFTGATYSFSNLNITTLYRAQVQSGVCGPQYSNTITITVNANSIPGSLLGNATVCTGSNTGILTHSGNNGNILRWEFSTDGTNWNSIAAHTSASYNYNNLTQETQYRVVVQNGVCSPAASNSVTILINATTVPGAVSGSASVCAGNNSGTLVLSGYTGVPVQWESSVDGGASWSAIANVTNQQSYSNLTATTLFRALVKNGVCPSQYSNNGIITTSTPTVAGTLSADATVCANNNNGTLQLNGYTGDILQWESSANNGGTWNLISNFTNSYTYNNLGSTTLYRALVKSGVCAAQYASNITITVSPLTVPGTVTADAVVCGGNNSGTLVLSGYTGGLTRWESSVDGGNTWTTIANTTDQQAYSNLTATTLFRALVQSGVCSSQYSTNGIITTNSPTVAGILSADATVCADNNNGSLQLNGYTGGILQWESSVNNGGTWSTISNTTGSYTYNNLAATTLYRALVKSGVCAPQYANNITITVTPVTVPGIVTANATVCLSANSGTLTLTSNNGNVLQWESSGNNGSSWSVINNTGTNHNYTSLTQTSLFRALVKNGICPAQYSGASVINVVPPPTIADAGPAQLLCNTTTATLSANTPVYGSGSWTLVSGNNAAVITNAQLPGTGITGLQTGNYVFAWTISNTVCPASSATVNIEVLPSLVNTIGVNNITICAGQQVNIPGAVATGGNGLYQYRWEMSTDGTSWIPVNGATANDYSFSPEGDVLMRRVAISNNCALTSAPLSVTVQKTLANNTITGNQAICDGTGITPITGTLATGGDGMYTYQWEQNASSSSGLNSNNWNRVDNATGADLPDIKLRVTTSFRRIVTTALCAGPQALTSNVVTVDVKPLPEISLQYKAGTYCSKDSSIEFSSTTNNVDSIKWDFGDGTIQTTGNQKIAHRYSKPGVFIPRLLVTSSGNCSVSLAAPDTIRIEEIKPGFRMTGVFDCGKTVYRFVDTSQSYFTIAKRTWLVNESVFNSTGKDFQYSFSSPGEYDARLNLQSIYGCENTVDAKFKVAIYQFPKADINAVNAACRNILLNFSSNESSVDSIIIRSWDMGNGSVSSDSVVSAVYTSAGMYNVKLTVATVNRCYDSALKQLQIHPTPAIQVPVEQVLCKGDSLRLLANGGVNYIWKDQENNIICNNCPSATVRPLLTAQYNVIGYSEFGCSEMASTRVRVIPPLTLNAKLLDTLCVGSSKRLTISGAEKYNWLPAPGLSNLTSPSPVVSPIATTTYTVIGKDAHDCFADTAQIKVVVGNPTPVTIGKDTVILAGNSIQLRAVSPLADIRKWKWEGADFSCLNCPTPVARVVNDACINCTVTNQYGCNSSDTLCIKTFCPTTEVFIPNAFTPDGDGINDRLFVQGKGIKMIKSFRVFSRWGELVFEKTNFSPGDPSMGWDGKVRGKAATPDVFVYVCEIICEKGTPSTFKGNTAIIK